MSDAFDEALAKMDATLGVETAEPEGAPPEGGTPAKAEPEGLQQEPTPDPETTDPEAEAAEPEAEAEAEAEAETAAPEVDEKFASYLSRFGVEATDLSDLSPAARKALEAGFEADRTIGRQGQEYGQKITELEQKIQQLVDNSQQQPKETPPPGQSYDPAQVAEYFADNPASIVPTINQAWQNNDRALVYLGIRALEDFDPVMAEDLRIGITKADALKEIDPHLSPLREQASKTNLDQVSAAAGSQFKALYPDFDQHAAAMNEIAEKNPHLLGGLAEGTVEGTMSTLETLYKLAAFEAAQQNTQRLTAAQQEAAEKAALEAKAAKHDAFVATGSQRVEPESQGDIDPLLAAFDAAAGRYMPTDD